LHDTVPELLAGRECPARGGGKALRVLARVPVVGLTGARPRVHGCGRARTLGRGAMRGASRPGRSTALWLSSPEGDFARCDTCSAATAGSPWWRFSRCNPPKGILRVATNHLSSIRASYMAAWNVLQSPGGDFARCDPLLGGRQPTMLQPWTGLRARCLAPLHLGRGCAQTRGLCRGPRRGVRSCPRAVLGQYAAASGSSGSFPGLLGSASGMNNTANRILVRMGFRYGRGGAAMAGRGVGGRAERGGRGRWLRGGRSKRRCAVTVG